MIIKLYRLEFFLPCCPNKIDKFIKNLMLLNSIGSSRPFSEFKLFHLNRNFLEFERNSKFPFCLSYKSPMKEQIITLL